MKKIILLFTAAVLSAGMAFAQDINEATENYNNGAMELNMGNNEAAIGYFQKAYEMATALGEEGAEVAENSRTIIPAIYLSSAKEQIKADNFDAAIEQLNKAIEAAGKYETPEVADDANALIPQVYLSKGNGFLQAKNFPEAEAAYKQTIELNPSNGMAYFRLGQALASQNKIDEAEAAYIQAAANGQEKNANKQLSNMFVKLAKAANKAKRYQETIDYAAKSNQYLENASAYFYAAGASQQLGKNADCITNYEKYLELSPNAKDAAGVKFTIAALYQQSGDKAKAKEYYQMVTTDPQYGASAQEQLKTL